MIPRRLRKYRGDCRRGAGRRSAGGDDPARSRRLHRARRRPTRLASRRSARSRAPNGASASRSRRSTAIGTARAHDLRRHRCSTSVRRVVMTHHADQGDRGRRRGRQSAMPARPAATQARALSRELRTADDRVFLSVIRRSNWANARCASAGTAPATRCSLSAHIPGGRVPARRPVQHGGERSGRARHARTRAR